MGAASTWSPILKAYDQIRQGRAPVLAVDPAEVHDYVYAGDVARAQLAAMASDVSADVFTIASGKPVSFEELIRAVLRACGSTLEPIFGDHADRLKSAIATKSSFSVEKAARVLGWTPRTSLDEGIRRLVDWCEENAKGGGA